MQKTLGGDRLGSGKKQKIQLHNYERSTHDLGYLWRSTMAAGTLVPFLCEVALPGDTFDINLNVDIKTHPTVGPLFGSYKVQVDTFQAPIRLYNGLLHNNALNIGMNMQNVYLPQLQLVATQWDETNPDKDNSQINPSCILSYLGIRGIGKTTYSEGKQRQFNAVPLIAYWDIYKNYFANKQEEEGAVIHTDVITINNNVEEILVEGDTIGEFPSVGDTLMLRNANISISISGTQDPRSIVFQTAQGDYTFEELSNGIISIAPTVMTAQFKNENIPAPLSIFSWRYLNNTDVITQEPKVTRFPLTDLDEMRNKLIQWNNTTPFIIDDTTTIKPYSYLTRVPTLNKSSVLLGTQEGLALKTYQSDLFNNWIQTEWIDGENGIAAVTAIDTTGGSFQIDTLVLARKVYDMLNRIAISGGSYDDWLDAVYTHERYTRASTPIYCGGLSKELVFQEVVSNSDVDTPKGKQPLGTLAGKGVMAGKHKGGSVTIKVDEPSYIIGIVSLTPRVDYSQGNKWDVNLQTLDDLHKPALDQIGFQDLIAEQMLWYSTEDDGTKWVQKAVGKQPAWLNYMTNVNQTRGNFAIYGNEMFMTLNRRYNGNDFTTYIDPSKFNDIFAVTALDAQNFWTQISVDMTARRKMSAKVMPNL